MTHRSCFLRFAAVLALTVGGCADPESDDHDGDTLGDVSLGDAASGDAGLDATDVGLTDAQTDETASDTSADAPAEVDLGVPDATGDTAPDAAQDTAPDAEDDAAPDSGEVSATWAEVEEIFSSNCAACHYSQPAGLSLAGGAYDQLVEVPSTQAPAMFRVTPGDPAASYLWRKLEGTHGEVGSGARMPQVGELTADELASIRAWIEGGALP